MCKSYPFPELCGGVFMWKRKMSGALAALHPSTDKFNETDGGNMNGYKSKLCRKSGDVHLRVNTVGQSYLWRLIWYSHTLSLCV